jgi:hypothetical protein
MVKLIARGTTLLLLAPVFALTLQGRQSGTPPRSGVDRVLAERARVFNNRRVEEELRRPAGRAEPRLAVAQIKEDYVRIQVVNSDLVRAASQGGALDLKFVAKSASEIRKRAERLKHNLALPEPEHAAERPSAEAGDEEARLRASVSTLGKMIAGFVRNPIFREVGATSPSATRRRGRTSSTTARPKDHSTTAGRSKAGRRASSTTTLS